MQTKQTNQRLIYLGVTVRVRPNSSGNP